MKNKFNLTFFYITIFFLFYSFIVTYSFAQNFSIYDLEGSWNLNWVNTDSSGNTGWAYGTIEVNSSGAITNGIFYFHNGFSYTVTSGSLNIDNQGTISGSIAHSGGNIITIDDSRMASDKNTSTFVATSTSGAKNFGLMVKEKRNFPWSLFIPKIFNTVSTVTSLTGRIWMDRNLGASRVAQSRYDTEAYGNLYQWGRGADGHEKRNSGVTLRNATSDIPGHSLFITESSYPYDWRDPQNNNLWQGVSGVNNPCPPGFRIPTAKEWEIERLSWSSNDSAGAFASPLKLVVAGYRNDNDGTFNDSGRNGLYWSSTVNGSRASGLYFSGSFANMDSDYTRANGFSIRCIQD